MKDMSDKQTGIYGNIDSVLRSEQGKTAEMLFRQTAGEQLRFTKGPVPVLFNPYILSAVEYSFIKAVSERMLGIAEKASGILIENSEIAEYFGIKDLLHALVCKNPGFVRNFPIARFDSYFDGKNLTFIELNAEGVACMHWSSRLNDLFLDFYPGGELRGDNIVSQNLKDKVLGNLLSCFGEFSPRHTGKPSIAIVDKKRGSTYPEFEAFRDFFVSRGHACVIADPGELSYDGERLRSGNFEIDIVYRRLLTVEYLPEYHASPALGKAYLDGKVCVSHPFRAYIGFSKKLFSFLWSEGAERFFSGSDISFIREHIPWTMPLKTGEVVFGEENIDLRKLLQNNRDEFVLKPANLYDGAGVVMGCMVSQEEWDAKVGKEIDCDYLVQKKADAPVFKAHDGTEYVRHLGEYLIDGKLTGFLTRAEKTGLINEHNPAFMVPTFALIS